MRFEAWVDGAATAFEAAGVVAMVAGTLLGAAFTITSHGPTLRDALRDFRQRLGRAMVLGLELLVASDILRTIPHVPTLYDVAVLAGIVLIRTFLSWALDVEIEGRWPWQPRPASEPRVSAPERAAPAPS